MMSKNGGDAISGISRHLFRRWRRETIPLPALKQGTTLSVRSRIPNVSLRIDSGWRDDGCASLVQPFVAPQKQQEQDEATPLFMAADMIILEEDELLTSLGRSESHISISLEPAVGAASQELSSTEFSGEEKVEEGTTDKEDVFDSSAIYAINVQVPEKINIICELNEGGSVDVVNKIEGDVKVSTKDGNIRVKKLRGHTIELETTTNATDDNSAIGSYIYATDLLEAENLRVNLLGGGGGRFRAKRIHGDTVDIRVEGSTPLTENLPPGSSAEGGNDDNLLVEALDGDDEGSIVDVSSMYVSGSGGANIVLEEGVKPQKRGVRLKSHHGPVMVKAEGVYKPSQKSQDDGGGQAYPLVELGSVNGSCEVSLAGIPDEDDTSDNNDEEWVACQVHYDSISPESVSLITAENGNIGLTIDRKLEADMRLLSDLDTTTLEMKASLLADDDDSEQVLRIISNGADVTASTPSETSRISIQTQSFTESQSYVSMDNQTEYVEGWVENKSHEPDSRFEMKTRGEKEAAVGKIRLDGAANQALKNFSSPLDGSHQDSTARPLIVAAAAGNVTVESLSWLGAIARRYGLDEKGRELGRQATRRGRVILPADE